MNFDDYTWRRTVRFRDWDAELQVTTLTGKAGEQQPFEVVGEDQGDGTLLCDCHVAGLVEGRMFVDFPNWEDYTNEGFTHSCPVTVEPRTYPAEDAVATAETDVLYYNVSRLNNKKLDYWVAALGDDAGKNWAVLLKGQARCRIGHALERDMQQFIPEPQAGRLILEPGAAVLILVLVP